MKTAIIPVTGENQGSIESLALTERLAKENGLDQKSVLHLRLLAEELFGILRGIAGEVKANYWLEVENQAFQLHMKANVELTDQMREQFLSSSSRKENAAARSFMGKVRVMIAGFLLSAKDALPYAMMNTVSAADGEVGASVWSMITYKDVIQSQKGASQEASEAWDELEKSIVANIADEVKVKIIGSSVEIIVYKAF